MSCKGLKGTPLKNCRAKALKKAKEYARLQKRHPNMTKNDTLLVNKSSSKNSALENFTDKKTRAAVALKLKEKKQKLEGNKAAINLIGTANAKSRKTTVVTTKGKKKLFKKRKTKKEYISTAVYNKKDLASKVTITKDKKKTQEELAAEVKAKETKKSNLRLKNLM